VALPSYAEIVAGRTAESLFDELIANLKGKGLPTTEWDTGEPIPLVLRWGLSPILTKVFKLGTAIAKSAALQGARELAEADLVRWQKDPNTTFLGWLARDFFNVVPKPRAFTVGIETFTNQGQNNRTITNQTIVATLGGLRYRVTDPAVPVTLAPGASIDLQITAESPGSEYNVAADTIIRIISSLPGVVCTNRVVAPATTWITSYGAGLEQPREVEERCRYRWARLSRLQVSPADAYRSLVLDPDITGTTAPRKLAVWPHYSAALMNHSPNAVTLFIAGESGPITQAQADQVRLALLPYIGLHDELFTRPTIAATYAPAGIVKVASAADVIPVQAGLVTVFAARQRALDIGQPVLGWEVRTWVGDSDTAPALSRVRNFIETLTDFVPPKNALVTLSPANLVVQP